MDERIRDISPKPRTEARHRYINTQNTDTQDASTHMANINTCTSAHTHTWVLPLCLSMHTHKHAQQMDSVHPRFKVTYLLYMYQVRGIRVKGGAGERRNRRQEGYCPYTWVKTDRKGFRIMLRCQSVGRQFL